MGTSTDDGHKELLGRCNSEARWPIINSMALETSGNASMRPGQMRYDFAAALHGQAIEEVLRALKVKNAVASPTTELIRSVMGNLQMSHLGQVSEEAMVI